MAPSPLQAPAGEGCRPACRLRRLALPALAAGLIAVLLQTITPFEHGPWLIAYLLLVGALAPFLLAVGEIGLFEDPAPGPLARSAPALWAIGTVAVPTGVFGDSRLIVALGSAALLLALCSMAAAALAPGPRRSASRRPALAWMYGALVLFMTVSVGVGLALAWDSPWI